MGRIMRDKLFYNGCFAHVFTRAIEKRKIFNDPGDFEFFRNKMAEVKKDYGLKIYHYCLMETHLYLVVRIGEVKKFSEGIKVLKQAYAHKYNKASKRFGAVWRDRYRAKLIEDERYMLTCGRYVENNPVEAGIVAKGTDWLYSSSRHYELGIKDPTVESYVIESKVDESLVQIGSTEFEKSEAIGSELFQYQIWKKLKK